MLDDDESRMLHGQHPCSSGRSNGQDVSTVYSHLVG